ncbi:MAG: response regulator [Anaerolineales bacterium]|nr:response regulator [Anaerolineales bacterium]
MKPQQAPQTQEAGQHCILLVDDDPDILEGLVAVLESQPYRLRTARDGEECLEMIAEEIPWLMILDLLMPRMDGFAVISEIRSNTQYATLSIIVLTTVIEDASRRRYELETGLEMDIQDYLEKPVAPPELLARVAGILEQPYILVADDDPDVLESITTVLKSQPYRLQTARDGRRCLELVRKKVPDLLILDLLMPMMDGFAVMRELRRDSTFADLPIMVLTAVLEDASHRRYELETGRSMRVQDYIEKPVAPAELLRRVEQLLRRTAP